MDIILVVFAACVLVMFSALWIYQARESTAFHEVKGRILSLESYTKNDDLKLQKYADSNLNMLKKISDIEYKLTCYTQLVDKSVEDVENLQEHCAKLRESQIRLKNILAGKKRTTTIKGPIQIEFVEKAKVLKKKMDTLDL